MGFFVKISHVLSLCLSTQRDVTALTTNPRTTGKTQGRHRPITDRRSETQRAGWLRVARKRPRGHELWRESFSHARCLFLGSCSFVFGAEVKEREEDIEL